MTKKTTLFVCFLLFTFLLNACGDRSSPVAPPTLAPSTTVSPTPLPTGTSTSTPIPPTTLPPVKRTQYTLQASLIYPDGILTVSEDILYSNRASEPLSELVFTVEANQTQGEFEILAENSLENGIPIKTPVLKGTSMTLPLNTPLQPGKSVALHLDYKVKLPAKAGVLSFASRQVNLSGWIVVVIPYIEGKGWLQHSPAAVGEYQINELADYDVSFNLVNAPENWVVAASTLPTDTSTGTHFVANNVRNFTLSISSDYEILESSVGNTRVRAFVFPEHLDAGFAALEATSKALELYSALFGPYERPSLSLVESTFADGIEFDGLFYLGQEYFAVYKSGSKNYLTALSAHETAHQWWYAMTSSDQALEPWLDEALCTFSERLFFEAYHPEDVDWWLQTRIQAYTPQGDVNSTIYDFTEFRPYVNAVYLRGAQFLTNLRKQIGQKEFDAFLKDYFETLKRKSDEDQLGLSTADTFWQVLSSHFEGDLSELRAEYFR